MRKLLPLAIALLSSLYSFAQIDLTSNLVGNYYFSGNANDASIEGNNGTVNGATLTSDRFGNTNSAYSFDGNDYISLSPANLKVSTFTYSAWVYITTLPTSGNSAVIISIGTIAGDQNISLSNNYGSTGNTGLGIGGYNVGGTVSSTITGALPTVGKWYHLTFTRSSTEIRLYVNGNLIKSIANTLQPYYGTSSQQANIGMRSHGNFQYFTGKIDDVKIYSRALSACEVSALANLTADNSLIAQYDFSGNADNTAGVGNNGTVSGATLTTDRHGNSNSAYSFDGINDKITMSATSLMTPTYTYSVWASSSVLPSNNSNQSVLAIGGSSGGDQMISLANNYSTGFATGWLGLGYDAGSGSVSGNYGDVLPVVNSWHHIVSTRSLDTMRLYINGILVKKSKITGNIGYGNSPFSAVVGARADGSTQFFNGKIDDIKVFNRELSACEISELFTNEAVMTSTTDKLFAQLVNLYPNPSEGKFRIVLPKATNDNNVAVLNSYGQLMYSTSFQSDETIDLSHLPKGIYLVKINADGKEASKKIIVK